MRGNRELPGVPRPLKAGGAISPAIVTSRHLALFIGLVEPAVVYLKRYVAKTMMFSRNALVLAATWVIAVATAGAGLPDTIEGVRPAIVGVGTAYPPRQPIGGGRPNQLRGTGFAVGDGLLIATNDHVLPEVLDHENRQSLAVFSGRGRMAEVRIARIAARDSQHDLAVLRISGTPLVPLDLGDDASVREGEAVAFTGFPIGAVLGLFPVTHTGIVASITPMARVADNAKDLSPAQLRRMRDPYDVFQLDAIAYPGNSGSPVYYPTTGKVIGVVNSVFVKESREAVLEKPSGISYAIPVTHLRALLKRVAP